MALQFITSNAGKFEEMAGIFPDLVQLELDLIEVQDSDPKVVIDHKLQEARKITTGEIMVEDTSLYFDALHGLPGPFIKWFLKKLGPAGLATMVEKLGNTHAKAMTMIGYYDGAGQTHFFEGIVEGEMVQPRGERVMGWDSAFQPAGATQTYAEMTVEEKNHHSMRQIAARKLLAFQKQGQ